ncbi:uncharacterized protein LOC141530905 isoform X2 [Cotesia typhae]|uniref:uncharacterized protein LOC141530905 isoform X2 n=1 Tax=Cotesia typhae TaxID=2053667 RepID=UPI003D690031
MTIPDHLWIIILKNLTIQKLIELRAFSRHFYRMVEYVLRKHPGWGDFVRTTISPEWLDDVMAKACPYDLISLQNDNHNLLLWRKVYIYYKKWQNVLESRYRSFTITTPPDFGLIKMASTFEDYILIGYEEDMIGIYTWTNNNLNLLFLIENEEQYLTQGEFWYCNGSLLVVSVDNQSGLRFWDLRNNIELINRDCFAESIHYNGCRDFCIGELSGILTSFERDGDNIIRGATENLELSADDVVLKHTFHKNIVSVLIFRDHEVRVKNYRVLINNGRLTGFQLVAQIDPIELNPVCLTQLSKYTFLSQDYFYVTSDFYGFATNYNETEDYLWDSYVPERFGPVTTMLMHAKLIILGFEDGSINIISIESILDMEEMTFAMDKIEWSRKIRVAPRPIFHLAVWTIGQKNHIVAITDENIHLIKFP